MSDREPRRTRADYRRFSPIQTRWGDNDAYGHVNNTVYYTWFDTTVNAWLIEGGFLDIEKGQTINLVVETNCRYFASLAYPEPIEIGLAVEKLGTSSVTYAVGVFRPGDHEAAAQGRFVHVAVDRATQRPVPIAPAMREALEELLRS